MRKYLSRNLFLSLITLGLAVGAVGLFHTNDLGEDVGDAPINNVSNTHVSLESGLQVKADDEEDEDEVYTVNEIILHYVNDDMDCASRAFYVWSNGVDGQEYSDSISPDIVSVSEDGSMMTIDMKLDSDARFTEFDKHVSMLYIIKYKMKSASDLNWGGQSEDVELQYAHFPPVNGVVEVWCTPSASGGISQFATEAETKVDGVKLAKFVSFKTISCSLTDNAGEVEWNLYAFDETYYKVKPKKRAAIKHNYLVRSGKTRQKQFTIDFKYFVHLNVAYSIESKDTSSTTGLLKTIYVQDDNLYTSYRFEKYYTYSGKDLGMTYTSDGTMFKVWSPVAANMTLNIYESGAPTAVDPVGGTDKAKYTYHMFYTEHGVWEIIVDDPNHVLNGLYYNYSVDTYNGSSVVMDPYATAAGANGQRALIYDKSAENVTPEGWNALPTNWNGVTGLDIETPQDLVVYEVHIQDFTGDESWVSKKENKRGTYNAFVEEGTTLPGHDTVTTGFDHLKELGVNAVQLMPVFDHDNDEIGDNQKYNWGYNPLNYNCVEGVYSSDPRDAKVRIKEFKNMVMTLADSGIRTIMDVVYNHVSSASSSNFNKLMPKYFFRYDENGNLYDGSGCNNEFRSEGTMGRKFIVDSLCMWAKDYKIKGFRFDLMGLIDTGTMAAAKKALYRIDPDIILYGEGWTSGGFHGGFDAENGVMSQGSFACQGNGNQVYSDLWAGTAEGECYLGAFNDQGRNSIRGGNDQGWGSETHLPGWGFISHGGEDFNKEALQTERSKVADMIWGAHQGIGNNPKQTVNYASCHDNWTLRDQLYFTLGSSGKGASTLDIANAGLTVNALILASNGISFMLGGEELLRTKDVAFVTKQTEKDKILANTYEDVYGHKLSHNSYNSPLEVNTFKWGNKISVSNDGTTFDMANFDNGVSYTQKYAQLIALHKEMSKFSFGQLYDGDGKKPTSAGNQIINSSWAPNDGNEAGAGIQFDEYFFYVGGRSDAYFSHDSLNSWTPLFISNSTKISYTNNVLACKYYCVGIYRRGA